ncbi:hypothetical protein ACET8O_20390 [Aeromonas veronii]
MITVTDTNKQTHHLALDAIAQVSEASLASRWHGVRTYIKTFEGVELMVLEDHEQIAGQIEAEEQRRYGA